LGVGVGVGTGVGVGVGTGVGVGVGTGVGVGVGCGTSSFRMVPVPCAFEMVAPEAEPNVTVKVSSASIAVSPLMVIATGRLVCPAAKVKVPDAAT
jgi:hypothetical protein